MVVKKPRGTWAIWTGKTPGLGKVYQTTEENGRIEYWIRWLDTSDEDIYGPEDINTGCLVIVKGKLKTIKALYGKPSRT